MTTQHDERAEFIRELEIIASTQWSGFFPGSAAERMKGIVQQAAALLAADAQAGGEAVYFCDYGHEGWGKIDASAVEQHRSWGMTVEKYYIHHQPQAVAQGWIPVNQQMPKSGQIVLALQKWDHSGKLGIIRAAWIAAKTEESIPESDIGEYDEATDTYYDPEGWYEQISHWDEISAAGVSGATIVAWMPLPAILAAAPKPQEPV